MKYNHKEIEQKWQDFWSANKIYTTPDAEPGKENFYLLVEFPYPSGNLHVGHWYAFAVPDILARYQRMQGKNVLYPIGFDAFGLPAENAAIKNGINPTDWTEKNIAFMKTQIQSMGASFDWSREVATCRPDYYKWTQWLFLELYKKGLVYRKETAVNWCPNDKTVLANEQVIDGKCDRCGSEVEQRQMLQWNIKITDYADRLIDDLAALDWPEQIKEAQRNWIGRSEGAEILFPLEIGTQRNKYKFVLLHGFRGGPDTYKWLGEQLRALGHEVITPTLPSADAPTEAEWVQAALNATHYDENTVLFGYSLGAATALKVLEKIPKPIGGLVLAGGFIDPNFADNPRNFEDTFKWVFDANLIKSNVKWMHFLHDTSDTAVSDEQAKRLGAHFSVPITYVKADRPHFEGEKELAILNYLVPSVIVFTTRPDTLFGATYLVLAPEHPWVKAAVEHKTVLQNNDEVQAYVERTKKMSDLDRQTNKEKTGVKLDGVEALNPATGERIPLYIADYVLPQYGTGAIMAVPAHDERDNEFAQKFNLSIRQVVRPVFKPENRRPEAVWRNTISGFVRNAKGEILSLKWKEYDWLTGVIGGIEDGEDAASAAIREIYEETGYKTRSVFVSPITVESHYFADHKNEWRSRVDTPVLLELESDTPDAISTEESDKHEVQWIPAEKLLLMEMFSNNKTALELALGAYGAYTTPRYGERQELVNSGNYSGLTVGEAIAKMTEAYGRKKTTYKLRDWIVSRQRYWGVPIPMIYCEKCGYQPVPYMELPVLLPQVQDYLPDGSGKSPLAKVSAFVDTACPKCGGAAQRETDTLDTFVDSSWYFLRYTDPQNSTEFAAREKQDNWMPVDMYSGGAEHTTMHLLYSRFWHKALFDIGLVGDSEPYTARVNHGMVLGPDGQKMSKSKGNVVDPDEMVDRLGADTVRMYLAFMGPYTGGASYPWNPDSVVGVRRFIERVAKAHDFVQEQDVAALNVPLHKALKKVGDDIVSFKFNTAISQLMILLNAIEKEKAIGKAQFEIVVHMIAPFAPHLAEELWQVLGNESSIHKSAWPAYDEAYLQEDEITVAVQINGKTRGEARVAAAATKDEMESAARAAVSDRLSEGEVVRVVIVPYRLVNFVMKI